MNIISLSAILQYFKRGDKPTEEEFADTFFSLRHKGEMIPMADVEGLEDALGNAGGGPTYESSATIEFSEDTADVSDHSLGLDKFKDIEGKRVLGNRNEVTGAVSELSPAQLREMLELSTTAETQAFDALIVTALRGGVATEADTLNKLYNLVLGGAAKIRVANLAARDAYNIKLGGQAFVVDDGDGKWALYEAITAGVGATYVKLSDPDLLNAVMSDAMIKSAYENNPDTNAFNDARLLALTNATAAITTLNTALLLKADLSDLSKSRFKRVNGNYTLLQADSGKYLLITGNVRTVTIPDGLTDEFHITIDIEGTGATIIDSTTTMYGDNTNFDNGIGSGNNYNVPQNGSFYFIRNTNDGRIRAKGDFI